MLMGFGVRSSAQKARSSVAKDDDSAFSTSRLLTTKASIEPPSVIMLISPKNGLAEAAGVASVSGNHGALSDEPRVAREQLLQLDLS